VFRKINSRKARGSEASSTAVTGLGGIAFKWVCSYSIHVPFVSRLTRGFLHFLSASDA
ncbi:hypothetical protein CPC08DRAFT_708296, partial [Agrocybe pediades]